jgi:NADPH-ferrihemoprotein reductase
MSNFIKSIFSEKNFNKKINYFFKRGNFPEIPNEKNVLIICTGTGISPIRYFLWERYNKFKAQNFNKNYNKNKNEEKNSSFGKILLFYGCRNEEKDFLYKEEFKFFEKEENFK